MHSESKLWIAYPKQTSKIVSDLNRDCSWEIFSQNSYEGVSLVALDHVWSAMRFKKMNIVPAVKIKPAEIIDVKLTDVVVRSSVTTRTRKSVRSTEKS